MFLWFFSEKFKKSVEDLEQKALGILAGSKNVPSIYSDVDCPALFNGENITVKYMSSALEMRWVVDEIWHFHITEFLLIFLGYLDHSVEENCAALEIWITSYCLIAV